ncbi:hypothetical protein NPIL_394971 [Nephila pilipes]|uniref:Uncharacterized protein n=1 Tax=Nephila pilipes TaxID=299642 RepID=A0A8X6NBB4_NEPPI|nr:hypothetical protein NPIL_394971 [Nephila pilipes]
MAVIYPQFRHQQLHGKELLKQPSKQPELLEHIHDEKVCMIACFCPALAPNPRRDVLVYFHHGGLLSFATVKVKEKVGGARSRK